MPASKNVVLSESDRAKLVKIFGNRTTEKRMIERVSIVLAAAEGLSNGEIADRYNCNIHTARLWRNRWLDQGFEGLRDTPGRGRKGKYIGEKEGQIIAATLQKPATETHWSARRLSKMLGVSKSSIHRVWSRNRLQPHRQGTFKYSNDPALEAKVIDIVGLYLNPPDKAVVLCVDEKSQIQALDRTQPLLPMKFGTPETRTHDYVRNGTTTLFAAFDTATGRVIGECKPRHRHEEFLAFLGKIEKAYPKGEVHIVLDNYATHKHPAIVKWLARRGRFHFHFTPTSGSWMNQVETWFSILTRQSIRRGSFDSVRAVIKQIELFIEGWNKRSAPFVWVKTADQILEKGTRKIV